MYPLGITPNESGRQVVLVSNIRDDNYYDPTYPNYIAGFYSPTFEAYFDRNIMSIDPRLAQSCWSGWLTPIPVRERLRP
jgi:hypothetical protein